MTAHNEILYAIKTTRTCFKSLSLLEIFPSLCYNNDKRGASSMIFFICDKSTPTLWPYSLSLIRDSVFDREFSKAE